MRLVEVGPRDGLQNEPFLLSTATKLSFIHALAVAGCREIEATSFVSPKWVPQLGDAETLWPQLPPGPLYSALIPNQNGLTRAMAVGVRRIAVFTAASEEFTRRNINMTIEESLEVFREVIVRFRQNQVGGLGYSYVRAYISTVIACPYEGRIDPRRVRNLVDCLLTMGVDEVSLGDTIGVGTPDDVTRIDEVLADLSKSVVTWHFHNTNGKALDNVARALELGYVNFDSSTGGFGGCPFAPGATGNLATEGLVSFLNQVGLPTGIDLDRLDQAKRIVLEAAAAQRVHRQP